MAYEAVLRDWIENPIDFIVADGVGIEKGALLQLTDPRTASAVSAIAQPIAGIAAREKVASDGRTRLAVFRKGIFDMVASGAIEAGNPVKACGTGGAGGYLNCVMSGGVLANGLSGAAIIGHALETAADQEVFQVFVNVGNG